MNDEVTRFLFVVDTLVFCENSQNQMVHSSWLLMWFEAISRLEINLEKSELIPIKGVIDVEELVMEPSCKVGAIPST